MRQFSLDGKQCQILEVLDLLRAQAARPHIGHRSVPTQLWPTKSGHPA